MEDKQIHEECPLIWQMLVLNLFKIFQKHLKVILLKLQVVPVSHFARRAADPLFIQRLRSAARSNGWGTRWFFVTKTYLQYFFFPFFRFDHQSYCG